MLFIETPIFTKLVCELLPDDDYRMIQQALFFRPETGKIIKGSGDLERLDGKRKAVASVEVFD